MSPWERLLEQSQSQGHFVQLYADESELARNAGHYLFHGLERRHGVLAFVTPERQRLFCDYLSLLGAGVPALIESRQLVFADAQESLDRFMVSGEPDWQQFENVIRGSMRQLRPAGGAEGLRAYGEMVGILWQEKRFAAAVRLEQFWNRLLAQAPFSLYCAYPIGVFDEEFEAGHLDGVLCSHTHLVPALPDGTLETALNRSMDEILGPQAGPLRHLVRTACRPAWAVMPVAEATLLCLRKNLPEQADRIVRRARRHYQELQPING